MAGKDEADEHGFLGEGVTNTIPIIRAENADWFRLAEDVNAALMRIATWAVNSVKTSSMSPEAVAVRVLLRSCGTFQGVILMTERGMVAEGRTLTRTLIENAFGIAALVDHPQEFMGLLNDDSEASRQNQRKFLLAEDLIACGATREKLQAAIDAIDGKPRTMSPKALAGLGPLKRMYLAYQRLSDDATHLSAKSLDRHVQSDAARSGWNYRWCQGDAGENAATLHHAISAAVAIGVGVSQFLKASVANTELADLAERFGAMPPVPKV